MSTVMVTNGEDQYDRAKEVKQFDDSKIGVKGLVDSGITTIPRFFLHPPESLPVRNYTTRRVSEIVPTIDLSGVDSDRRSTIVEQMKQASSKLGFFQLTNHGVSRELLDRTINSIWEFYELPTEIKSEFYRREMGAGVAYSTNVDLFNSNAATWKDTIQISLGPKMADPEMIPEICRTAVIEWQNEITRVGEVVMGLLSEGLGVDTTRLKEMTCLGTSYHTDPVVLTVLQQNDVAGLEIKYGEEWVIVKPVPGALVVNIGDILQIMSNDVYKSVQHRVLANPLHQPRISAVLFFFPGDVDGLYGPLSELVTLENPALYQQFTASVYMKRFHPKKFDGTTLTGYYKL